MRKEIRTLMIVPVIFVLAACSRVPQDIGKTTKTSTATGAAIGAGLGAVLGNQTGSTGGGLVVGALAGSGAGALVGRALEMQEKKIVAQSIELEEQQRLILQQQRELDQLRQMGQDRLSFAPELRRQLDQGQAAVPSETQARAAAPTTIVERTTNNIQERNIVADEIRASWKSETVQPKAVQPVEPVIERTIEPVKVKPQVVRRRIPRPKPKVEIVKNEPPKPVIKEHILASTRSAQPISEECTQAQKEISAAKREVEMADKLFHFRRALRLCPTEPAYHNGLGELYLSLNREEDAKFEFQEALKLDGNFQPAKQNLARLR